jgi:hypothetical protein
MASYGAFDGIVSIDMECKTVVPWAVVRNRKWLDYIMLASISSVLFYSLICFFVLTL